MENIKFSNKNPPSLSTIRGRQKGGKYMKILIDNIKFISFLTVMLAGCGMNSQTQIEAISCEQMKVLAGYGALPITQAEQNELREDLAQKISDSLNLGTVPTPMAFCDY